MTEANDLKVGRSPFPLHGDDKDYSGLDIHLAYLAGSNDLSHSFMNGANFVDSIFLKSALDQCEFAEAYIERTQFKHCDLSGSDLVRTKVVDTTFENCIFENGEWRESEFEQVTFISCDFTHTTINLCVFIDCVFSDGSVVGLNHRSVNYNVFTSTRLDELISSEYVLAQNFGLPGANSQLPVVRAGISTLGEACRLSDTSLFRVRDFIGGIEGEIGRQTVRTNKLVLEFIANITVALATTRRISPSSMLYVEQIFAQVAQAAISTADFQAAMNAVLKIRNSMYDLVMAIRTDLPSTEGYGRKITAYFEDTFSEDLGTDLADVLSWLFFQQPGQVTLTSIRHGSTLMEFLLSDSVPIMSLASTLGLIFTQASVIVSKTNQIKDGVKHIFARKASASKALVLTEPQPEKVPAILKSGTVLPELGPIRIAVERSGKTLITLDNRVEITIHP